MKIIGHSVEQSSQLLNRSEYDHQIFRAPLYFVVCLQYCQYRHKANPLKTTSVDVPPAGTVFLRQ